MSDHFAFLPHALEGKRLDGVTIRVLGLFTRTSPPNDDMWLIVLPNGRPAWEDFDKITLSAMLAQLDER